MRFIRISQNSGLKVSIISLGTWHLPRLPERDEAGAYRIDLEEFRKVLK
ncbi:MAG TPA: aldo/keto reductase, partial [Thermoprotei archaeon]|nr:aldo/keto reductase [Thermoprotei archaeon]